MHTHSDMKTTLTDEQMAALDYVAARHGRNWRRHATVAAAKNSADLYVPGDMADALVSAVNALGKELAQYEPNPDPGAKLAPSRTDCHAFNCGI